MTLLFGFSAKAQVSPQVVSLQGRILYPSGQPLEAASVQFNIEILSPGAEECLLYQETHTINMTGSGGVFALNLGSGTRAGVSFEDTSTLAQVFNNASAALTSLTCTIGTSYTPASTAKRRLKIAFDDGGGLQTVTQVMDLQSVPFALYADSLQGREPANFVQTSAQTTQVKIDALAIDAAYNELIALINGTTTQYTKVNGSNFLPIATVDFNSQRLTNLATPTVANDAVNKTYSDTKFGGSTLDLTGLANNQSVRWNQALTKWEAYTPSTLDSTKLPLAGGTMIGAIDMNGNNILGAGHITMASQRTIHLGTYTDAQETTLVGTLAVIDEGKTWYNSDDNQVKYWTGAAVAIIGNGVTGTSATEVTANQNVPNCLSNQKLQMSLGPLYTYSCVDDLSQWVGSSGSTIYYTGGNVGIGVASPVTGARLDITGTGAAASSMIIPRDTVANRPTVGVNGMIRYASDTNKFEVFQNGSWVDMIGTATTVTAGNGSSGSPSMSFSGDPNTGFYSNGADTIGIATNGANVFNVSTTSLSSPTTGGALITSGNGTVGAPTFSFAGDPDTGWWRPAADTMAASTAGSERVRIDSSGNVGVGTSNPQTLLHLQNSVPRMSFFDSDAAIGANNPAWGIRAQDNLGSGTGGLIIQSTTDYSAYANAVAISNTGSVGIGTITPGYTLDVQGPGGGTHGDAVMNVKMTTADNNSFIHVDTTTANRDAGIRFRDAGTSKWAIVNYGTDDSLYFYNHGTSSLAMAISPTNSVGIGTANPSNILDVSKSQNGQTTIAVNNTNAGASAAANFLAVTNAGSVGFGMNSTANGSGVAYVWNNANTDLAFATNNTEKMRITAAGDALFGADVTKQINLSIIGGGGAIGTSATWPMFFYPGGAPIAGLYNNGGMSLGRTYFSNTAPNDGMIIEGNVGIGTAGPLGKLDVVAPSNTRLLLNTDHLDLTTNVDAGGWARSFRVTQGNNTNGQDGGAFGVTGTGATPNYAYMAIPTADATGYNSTKILVLNNSGNVGIGNLVPSHRLHVTNSASAFSPQIAVNNLDTSANAFAQIAYLGNGRTFSTGVGNSAATGYDVANKWFLYDLTSDAMRLVVNSTGNVGVGTTTPGYKLDVNGDVNITAANALRFGGASVCTSAGCTAVSDVRLKENIQPLENSLEKILQLQGVEYDYRDKAKFSGKHQIGVIAQDTEKIYPEVVVTDEKTGFKAVAYDHLVAPLIEAVKALYNRIVGIEDNQAAQARQLANVEASKADKAETDDKIQSLETENAQLKDRAAQAEKENAKIMQENVEIKARLEKIEKALNSK